MEVSRACTSPAIEFQRRPLAIYGIRLIEIIIFSRNPGISIRRFSTFPLSNDRRFVEGAMRKKYIYIFLSRLGAELRGGDPFAMQVTPHPPSRYLPAWASCTCGRTPRNAERVGVCTPRDRCGCGGRCTCRHRQNLSAMHDRSVAYKPRRAARHYAGRKQKDDSLAAGQSPFAC